MNPKMNLDTEHIITTRTQRLQPNDKHLTTVEVALKGFIVADVGLPGTKYDATNNKHVLKFVERVEAHHQKMCSATSTELHWVVIRSKNGTVSVSQDAQELGSPFCSNPPTSPVDTHTESSVAPTEPHPTESETTTILNKGLGIAHGIDAGLSDTAKGNTSPRKRPCSVNQQQTTISKRARTCVLDDESDTEDDADEGKSNKEIEISLAPLSTENEVMKKNRVDISVYGMGNIRRDKIIKLIMAAAKDLGVDDMYKMHTSAGGSQKPSYTFNDQTTIFSSAVKMINHMSTNSGIDIMEELKTDPTRLFSTHICNLPAHFFTK